MMSDSEEGGAQQPTPPPLPPSSILTGTPKVNPMTETYHKKTVPKSPPTPTALTPFTPNNASNNQDQTPVAQPDDGSKGSKESPRFSRPLTKTRLVNRQSSFPHILHLQMPGSTFLEQGY